MDGTVATAPYPPELRRDVERWFVRRGVPQLIEGYSSEPAMDARAAPYISLWLVLGTVLHWGTRPDWPAHLNVIGVVATIAWASGIWTAIQHWRGRTLGRRPQTLDGRDILTIGLLPALPAALIDGSAAEAVTATLGALAGIGAIYLVIGFGLIEIALWAVERLWIQLAHIVELVARTLPLLLILVVFLLFAAEIWEAAHAMRTVELVVVLLLLLAVATLLVVTTFRVELRAIESRIDWDGIIADASGTPAAALLPHVRGGQPPPVRLGLLARLNVTALVAIQQLLQGVFVAAFVMAFLVAFGLIALPVGVQERWIDDSVRVLGQFELLGESRTVSEELLTVSALLGGIVGLYFTGLSITDPVHRAQQFDGAVTEVRQLLAARSVYAAALRSGQPTGDFPSGTPAGAQPGSVGRPPSGQAST